MNRNQKILRADLERSEILLEREPARLFWKKWYE